MNSPNPGFTTFSPFPPGKSSSSTKHYLRTPVDSKSISRFSNNKYTSLSPGIKETLSDRFIPVRACTNLYERFLAEDTPAANGKKEHPSFTPSTFSASPEILTEDTAVEPMEDSKEEDLKAKVYNELLKTHVLQDESEANSTQNENKLSSDSPKTKFNKEGPSHFFTFRKEYKCGNFSLVSSPITKVGEELPICKESDEVRKLPQSPYKILDAPGLKDDFYLNTVDWSVKDVLSVGLQNTLYTLKSNLTKVESVLQLNTNEEICSVSSNPSGTLLVVGLDSGLAHVLDIQAGKVIGTYPGHLNRATCASWCNDNLFSTGSRDKRILDRDVRDKAAFIRVHEGHKQEICGIKWGVDERFLATGGNDDKVLLWSLQHNASVLGLAGHTAAVKALAWNPLNPNLLATGGGTADRTIKFWDCTEGKCVKSVDTGSQVCSLIFSKNTKELVSAHGFSNNTIGVWKTHNLAKVCTMAGHTSRVLYMAMSPDGETVVTGAGDETLRFWSMFPPMLKSKGMNLSSVFPSFMDVR